MTKAEFYDLRRQLDELRGIVRELQAEITRLQATAARVEHIRDDVSYLMAHTEV
jgi:prefoldin subunit 5